MSYQVGYMTKWTCLRHNMIGFYSTSCPTCHKEETMQVRIKKLSPDAQMPTKATPGAAGYDLYAAEDAELYSGVVKAVSTGLSMEIPDGYEVQIRPRSGLAAKHGITVANAPGTIDSDYRGEVKVLLTIIANASAFKIKKGDRIAQMVVSELAFSNLEEVQELSDTKRGSGGFGSTGA